MSTVDERIGEFRTALGVRSDRKLAEHLGITVAAISAWRRRGVIPAGIEGKVSALAKRAHAGQQFAKRMQSFPTETWGKGVCLALYLAPSCDVLKTKRFPATVDYGALLESYASSFNSICMACAEEIEARMHRDGTMAVDALGSLTQEDERDLYSRIMERANWWKFAGDRDEIDDPATVHDRRRAFKSRRREDD